MSANDYRSAHEILQAARKRIEDPRNWTRNADARNADGEPCSPTDPAAVAFDLLGAVYAETLEPDGVTETAQEAIDRLYAEASPVGPMTVNDTGSHGAVLALYDRAITATMPQGMNTLTSLFMLGAAVQEGKA